MAGTPKANHFTANTDGSWYFYVDTNVDVRRSGAGIPAPGFTWGDWPVIPPMGSSTKYCESYAGATFDVKVNACIAAVLAAGGGTADASGLKGFQTSADNIVVGDELHPTILLLGPSVITFATGKQLKYRGRSKIIGYSPVGPSGTNGTYIARAAGIDITPVVVPYQDPTAPLYAVYDAEISNLSIGGPGAGVAGSIALEIGVETDVAKSIFRNITTHNVDIGVLMGGPGGCACYNKMYDITASGTSYGLKVTNDSGWPSDVNDNQWYNGIFNGLIGLYDKGGLNSYYSPTFENNATASFILAKGYANIISPYEEASGRPIFDVGSYGSFISSGGATRPINNSGNDSNMVFGPNNAPITLGVQTGLYLGPYTMYDTGVVSDRLEFLLSRKIGPGRVSLDYASSFNYYGLFGPAPFYTGFQNIKGGASILGKATLAVLANPSPPTVVATGGGATPYTYAIVCRDFNGGITLASAFSAPVNGQATLGSVISALVWPTLGGNDYAVGDTVGLPGGNADAILTVLTISGGGITGPVATLSVSTPGTGYTYLTNAVIPTTLTGIGSGLYVSFVAANMIVTPPLEDGCNYTWDILKTNDTTRLVQVEIGNSGASAHDIGQATAVYVPPTRNSTGDFDIAGQLTIGTPLGSASGGTGNGFTKFTGPTTAEKTFTLPNASATILTTNAAVTLAQGGTGLVQTATQQITTNGTQILAGACQAQPAATISGVTTTSTATWGIPTALPATWQTGIHVMLVVTADTVTLNLCNGTAGNITPATQLVNIKAIL
jgi:hypothetical protein